jgi:hypothetical protein
MARANLHWMIIRMDKNDLERWLERAIGESGTKAAPTMSPSPSLTIIPSRVGWVRIADCGQTLANAPRLASMVSRRGGLSARLFRSVLAHHGLAEAHGVIYLEAPADRAGGALFRFVATLVRLRQILGMPNDA